MNPKTDRNLEHRFQKLENQINSVPSAPPDIPQQQKTLQTDQVQTWQLQLNRFKNWFNSLSKFGKLIFIGIAAIVGMAIGRSVLQLITAVISLAVLVGLLYFVYQFFLVRSAETKD